MCELLAPAGDRESLIAALNHGADAIYLGGHAFHMRSLRRGYHFDDQNLLAAAQCIHERGKKLYVTVNNLVFESELDGLQKYLRFLEQAEVDALIVQDLGLLRIATEMGLSLPLHGSVQLGCGNLETLRELQALGLQRVVLSRNVTLDELHRLHSGCDLELEYFVHGDTCISHEGQCRLSGFAGMSGNRGRCLKPCRWAYRRNGEDTAAHYLAEKDLCLLTEIPKLLAAGVTSLKIEGRMRSSEHIGRLVSVYRAALDNRAPTQELQKILDEHRVRDYCTGGLYGAIQSQDIGKDGQREPGFVSRSFHFMEHLPANPPEVASTLAIHVRTQNVDSLAAACEHGADSVSLPLLPFRELTPKFSPLAVRQAVQLAHEHGIALFLETPLVVPEKYSDQRAAWLQQLQDSGADGLIVHDLGSLKFFRDHGEQRLIAGEGLNVCNSQATALLRERGAQAIVLSTELCGDDLPKAQQNNKLAIIIQGRLCAMVTDLCLSPETGAPWTTLTDEREQCYPVLTNDFQQSLIYTPFERCAISGLGALAAQGIQTIVIDGTFYNAETISRVLDLYHQAMTGDVSAAQTKLRHVLPTTLIALSIAKQQAEIKLKQI